MNSQQLSNTLATSLSLRRAWIEMELMARDPAQARVALLTESVD